MIKNIIKRDGSIQPWTPSKLVRWGEWGAKYLGGRVDWACIVADTVNELNGDVTSKQLQETLIEVTMRGEDWPHYLMAGRLLGPLMHKEVYGEGIPSVQALHMKLANLGFMVELDYSDAEYAEAQALIDHKRDFSYPHFRLDYIMHKYALQDRVRKIKYETPQFVYMRCAMALAEGRPRETRMQDVAKWYTYLSLGKINAPTPNLVNLGTPLAGFASCCIYTNLDTAISIGVGLHIAYTMTYMSAGTGTFLNTRSFNDPVRGGSIKHQGKLPYIRATKAMVEANLQNGRGGANTLTWSAYDPEGEVLVALQNPMSVEERKIRGIDYSQAVTKHLARMVARKEKFFKFNCFTAPDLFEAMFGDDPELFETLYAKYEADPLFVKEYFNAREIVLLALNEGWETGRYYQTWLDTINSNTPFYDPIPASNLCVAPETKILTDKGYVEIQTVANTKVNVWNGQEWSNVEVLKTGENQELLTVFTDSGHHLECTPYHKFYVVDGYGLAPREVRAQDLKEGDWLIKFNMPVVEGTEVLDKPYINGFYSGDGCLTPSGQRIYLYGDKRNLIDQFPDSKGWYHQPEYARSYAHYTDLQDKFFVPDSKYNVASRLEWLAGYADADGCIYRNNGNQQLVVNGVNFKFLREVQYMLDTLGVSAKLRHCMEAGLKQMPLNDGTGGFGEFNCKEAWRLIVNSTDLQHLMKLGLEFKRLKVAEHTPQRDARKFIKVSGVVKTGRIADTYCFSEPKRHMGIFNGILTGQCQEIMLPQRGYEAITDLYKDSDVGYIHVRTDEGEHLYPASRKVRIANGEGRKARPVASAIELDAGDLYTVEGSNSYRIVLEVISRKHEPEVAMCNIAAVVPAEIKDDAEYLDVAYYTLLMIDVCIHKAHYELPHVGFTSKARMNAGVGMMGVAHWMAQQGFKYDSAEGKNALHRLNERHLYWLIQASLKLGQEYGNAPWMHKTRYPEGWLPMDKAPAQVDKVHTQDYVYDWGPVRQQLIDQQGMRFSCLVAHMPGESSSKASGQPNSIYPVRETVLGKSDDGIISRWAAPDNDLLQDAYSIAWDLSMTDQVDLYGITQKFTDQGISADLWRRVPEGDMITSTEMINTFLYMTSMGMKSSYYKNALTSKRKQMADGSVVLVSELNTSSQPAADCGAGGCKM